MIGELRKIAAEQNVYVIFVRADLEDGAIALHELLGRKETAHHSDIEVRAAVSQHGGTGSRQKKLRASAIDRVKTRPPNCSADAPTRGVYQ